VKDYTKETDARIVIDDLLRQAGWDPLKITVLTEFTVYVRIVLHPGKSRKPQTARLASFSVRMETKFLPVVPDYVLQDRRGRPLAIIEAKRTGN